MARSVTYRRCPLVFEGLSLVGMDTEFVLSHGRFVWEAVKIARPCWFARPRHESFGPGRSSKGAGSPSQSGTQPARRGTRTDQDEVSSSWGHIMPNT
ncbi:hypothetical protein RRG08_066508 [Elysia crispata]|uniref:Uncharacterized protein n=1 Tax=Elysia crispata TaxID=231223 RepID=A0AAE1CZS4_9GAST|nr:hypothetical protein RRG08_066508 [Elysia crispata]